VASSLPSGEKATLRTGFSCPDNVARGVREATSQSRAVLSALAVASVLPSGENARANTSPVCPVRAPSSLPVSASHSLISPGVSMLSQTPATEARVLPSGEKATPRTGRVWPVRTLTCAARVVSHTLMVLSSQPRATRLPSGA
jgi:hypothetical protein